MGRDVRWTKSCSANRPPILRAGDIPSYSFLLLSNVHRHVLPRCVLNQND